MAKNKITEKEIHNSVFQALDVAAELAEHFEEKGYKHPSDTIGGVATYVAVVIEDHADPHGAFMAFEEAVNSMRHILKESKKQR